MSLTHIRTLLLYGLMTYRQHVWRWCCTHPSNDNEVRLDLRELTDVYATLPLKTFRHTVRLTSHSCHSGMLIIKISPGPYEFTLQQALKSRVKNMSSLLLAASESVFYWHITDINHHVPGACRRFYLHCVLRCLMMERNIGWDICAISWIHKALVTQQVNAMETLPEVLWNETDLNTVSGLMHINLA